MRVELGDALVEGGNLLVALEGVELEDAPHLYLEKAYDVVVGDGTHELLDIALEASADMVDGLLARLALLVALLLIYTFLDEDALEGGEMQLLPDLGQLYLELAAQYVAGVLDIVAQHIAHAQEMWLVVGDDTAVGRHRQLAVGEGIEGVDGAVARRTRQQMHQYVGVLRGVVLDLAYLDLAGLRSLDYRLDECRGGLAVGNLGDGKGLVVDLLYLGTDPHGTSAFAVVVSRHIYGAPGEEIGIERELLAPQMGYGGIDYLVEIVGQNL